MNLDLSSLNLPPEVVQEIEEFTSEVERRNRGEANEEDFKRFRLQQGIYGQRQEEEQMVRTKLPYGRITSDQMEVLAEYAEKYSHGILHVTTRQDVQFHYVKLKDVPEAMTFLSKHGITTREACGNTVRNVTACHKSGTCKEEYFDATPYAQAVSEYLLRHQTTQNLPRKFKISFGGCRGCGLAPIHDIGLNARVQNENGKEIRGFRVLMGGGLGSSPHSAQLLTEFLPVGDLLRTCEAIVRVFDKYGDKQNRNKARFKFVLDKLGLEKVRELVQEEFEALANTTYPEIDAPDTGIPATATCEPTREFDADPDFINWKSRNTCAQKQDGFHNVQIKLLLGDMTIPQARAIGKISKDHGGGSLTFTVHQNVMIPWVKEEAFGRVFAELKKIDLHKSGTEELKDITCCPGSETCNLGITHSRGLAATLTESTINKYTSSQGMDGVSIKISGCPNSCGQHHIASMGFNGGAKKVNGVLTPHYEVMMGGRVTEDRADFGTPVIKIPAKNVAAAVSLSMDNYKENRKGDETFSDYFDRMGKKYFTDLLQDLKNLPPIEEAPDSYIDFFSKGKFSLDDRGQGECAGAMTDIIQDHMAVGDRALFQAKLAIEKDSVAEAARHSNRAIAAYAHALLMTEGMDFSDDRQTLEKFQSLMVETGIVSESFEGIAERFTAMQESADLAQTQTAYKEAQQLAQDSQDAYQKMKRDKSLRIRVGSTGNTGSAAKPAGAASGNGDHKQAVLKSIDLLGVKYPNTYVKTKLQIESLEKGARLEVLVDSGESSDNIPGNLQKEGHILVSMDKVDGHYKMIIEKV